MKFRLAIALTLTGLALWGIPPGWLFAGVAALAWIIVAIIAVILISSRPPR